MALIGRKVKIGICPVIDGRRMGVRESLEEQTMAIARATANLISSNVRYSNGEPVECVIADTTIGGVAEAAKCEQKFEEEGVGVSVTVTPCWCYGTEVMDTNPSIPKAIFGFNGTERPGAVFLAAAMAAYAQKGMPAFAIYGHDVRDAGTESEIPDDVAEKLIRFAKAGLAAAQMKGKSYLSIGTTAMGIAGSMVDADFYQDYLGMRNEYVDMCEISRRIEKGIYDKDEFEKALKWVKEKCVEGEDKNKPHTMRTREQKDGDWEFVVKMALIAKDLLQGNEKLAEMGFVEESNGHNAIIGGFQGQRQWTDYLPNGDFMESILNSSFDWNGKRAPYIFATESDNLNAVSMLFGNLLTNTPQVFCDVRTYWSPESVKRVTGKTLTGDAKNGFIHLLNSGAAAIDGNGRQTKDGKPAMKPFWEISDAEVEDCLKNVKWSPANTEYFRGGGFSSTFLTRGGMPMTMIRLNLIKGMGPVLQIAEGVSVELDPEVHETLNNRTDPTWPCTWFAPRLTGHGAFTDVYSVMANWGANHCAFSYGHIGADLITLASLLRIPVSMHNVPQDKIFRPHVWSAFGTESPEGADFRACKNFGATYK